MTFNLLDHLHVEALLLPDLSFELEVFFASVEGDLLEHALGEHKCEQPSKEQSNGEGSPHR